MTQLMKESINHRTFLLVITFVLIVLNGLKATSDIIITIQNSQKTKVLYSIRKDNLKQKPGYYFAEGDTIFYSGYSLLTKLRMNGISENGNIYGWVKDFKNKILLVPDSANFNINLYTKGISSYCIHLHLVIHNIWFDKTIELNYDGYQVPINFRLSEFILKNFQNCVKNNDSIFIDKVVISVTPKEKGYQFIIGNFEIFNTKFQTKEFYHPFFDCITGKKSSDFVKESSLKKFHGIPILTSGLLLYNNPSSSSFYVNTSNNESIKKIISEVFKQILEHYPFYEERGINKKEVIEKFNTLNERNLEINKFKDSLAAFVWNFHDPHFYIPNKKEQKEFKLSPISLFEINNEYLISAIYDTTLAYKISVGDEVIEVNQKSINKVVDSLSCFYLGTPSVRKEKAISNLLRGNASDTCHLTVVVKSGEKLNITITFDRKLIIPNHFKPIQADFKKIEKDIYYYKINKMSPEVWYKLISQFNELRAAKGLIIDLRGNGGGDLATVIRLFSVFVNKPSIFYHSYFPPNGSIETTIINPDPKYNFNLQPIILTDSRTACGAELFAYEMRKYANAKIVSDSRTSGAYAWVYELIFPDGFKIKFNCLIKDVFDNENTNFEGVGLSPDVWVYKNSIADLYPYDDKVLKTAITLLKYTR